MPSIWTWIMIVFALVTIIWFLRPVLFRGKRTYGITQEEMNRLVEEEGGTVVDVRTPKEYKKSHIPGAEHLQAEHAEKMFPGRYPDKDKPYIVYCASGMRSGIVADQLKKLGYTNIHDFKGMRRYKDELEESR